MAYYFITFTQFFETLKRKWEERSSQSDLIKYVKERAEHLIEDKEEDVELRDWDW